MMILYVCGFAYPCYYLGGLRLVVTRGAGLPALAGGWRAARAGI